MSDVLVIIAAVGWIAACGLFIWRLYFWDAPFGRYTTSCERMTTMPKRINPRRRPATQADVQRAKDTATADACRVTLAIFFTALLDKEGMDAEQLQRIWHEVEALSESVRDGYVSAPDLIRVLREEYEIDIIGG